MEDSHAPCPVKWQPLVMIKLHTHKGTTPSPSSISTCDAALTSESTVTTAARCRWGREREYSPPVEALNTAETCEVQIREAKWDCRVAG